jgi:hypothetical protein
MNVPFSDDTVTWAVLCASTWPMMRASMLKLRAMSMMPCAVLSSV